MERIYNNREANKVLKMFDSDPFWNNSSDVESKTYPTKKNRNKETNIECVVIKQESFVFDCVNKEMIEKLVNNYITTNKIIQTDSVKRMETAVNFIVESLVLILNSMKLKQCIWEDSKTYPTKKNRNKETNIECVESYKAIGANEIKTLCNNNYYKHIINLLNTICLTKKHYNGRNLYCVKPEYLNNDKNYSVMFQERICKTTGEITIPATIRWQRQMDFFVTQYGSGKNVEIEKEQLFELKWPTKPSVEVLLKESVDNKVITLDSLKRKQQKKTLEENISSWLKTYEDCVSKIKNNPANKSSKHSRIYTGFNCLPKQIRTIVNELNNREEIDASSMFPNILLAIVTGTLKNKEVAYKIFEDNDLVNLGTVVLNKHFSILKEDKIHALKTLGGKFRQKLCSFVKLPDPKIDLMTYINCSFIQHTKIGKMVEITEFLCKNNGTKSIDELLIYMKKNWRKKTNLVKELLEAIEAQIMQEFQIKLYNKGISGMLVHDAISVPKDKVEIVKIMFEEHLTEWGIPTENNIETLINRIKGE